MRCLVVGAGIVGICSALYLRRDGHDVVVIDRSGPGEGASKGNAGIFATGHVVPMGTPEMLKRVPGMLLDSTSPLTMNWSYLPRIAPWLIRLLAASTPRRVEAISRALAALLATAAECYRPLLQCAGAEDLVQRRGWLMLYESENSRRAAQPSLELRRRRGIPLDELDEGAIRQLVPGLRPGAVWGVMLPDCEHTVDPYRLTVALAEAFVGQGGTIHRGEVRTGVGLDGRPQVTTDAGPVAFDALVIAGGAWSRTLLRGLGDDAPLDTERGYHVMIENNIDLRMPLLCADHKFSMTPMTDGIRLGGTVEFAGLEAPANPKRWDIMARRARALLPGLKSELRSTWMGFRPSMPDSLPVIGPSPRHPNVFYAFGHGHLGLTLGAVTGRTIADLIAGRSPAFDVGAYQITRF
jgi:glycine/D-amino acid oxidase-like deaminating enzyme